MAIALEVKFILFGELILISQLVPFRHQIIVMHLFPLFDIHVVIIDRLESF